METITLRCVFIFSTFLLFSCGDIDNGTASEKIVASDMDKPNVEKKLDNGLLAKNQFLRWKSIKDDDREL